MIQSKNTSNSRSTSNECFNSLVAGMCLCIGLKIILNKNLLNVRLFHSLMGIIKEITCIENTVTLELLKLVFVEFKDYAGPLFFPNNLSRRHWFLIYPLKINILPLIEIF